MGATCHQGVIRTCSEKIRNSAREEKMRSSVRRPAMVKSSTVASSTPSQSSANNPSYPKPSQVKASSKSISSATSSPHQSKQQQNSQQWKPNQNQLRRKLSRKLELMPQLDWRAFQGSGVTKFMGPKIKTLLAKRNAEKKVAKIREGLRH